MTAKKDCIGSASRRACEQNHNRGRLTAAHDGGGGGGSTDSSPSHTEVYSESINCFVARLTRELKSIECNDVTLSIITCTRQLVMLISEFNR
jgi:hypothetical protein